MFQVPSFRLARSFGMSLADASDWGGERHPYRAIAICAQKRAGILEILIWGEAAGWGEVDWDGGLTGKWVRFWGGGRITLASASG